MDRVAIALGSNLGDRRGHLDYAVSRLKQLLTDVVVSRYVETAPVGVAGSQPDFLNAVAVGSVDLPALDLLYALLAIERERGRERPFPTAARTLDVDLILYGDAVINQPPALIVPHPRFRSRLFVLNPLAEIAPDLRDPVTRRTISELLQSVKSSR